MGVGVSISMGVDAIDAGDVTASVQQAGGRSGGLQHKGRHGGLEACAVDRNEKEMATHHAGIGAQLRPAGVLKHLPGL